MQVGLVVVGLVVRSSGKIREALVLQPLPAAVVTTGSSWAERVAAAVVAMMVPDVASGVALVALSALGYSLLGCLYEWLSAVRGPAMSHAQV